jgi:probable FeS assembly SUF system protein SufT
MYSREQVTLARDVEVIQIPDGLPAMLAQGSRVLITQELGGAFTVMTDYGAMFRVDERNADALGKEGVAVDHAAPDDGKPLEERVWDQLRKCYDPEIPVNIVDLGLVYNCTVEELPAGGGSKVQVKMTLTAPGCGMGPVLADDVKRRVEALAGVAETDIEIVFDPPWGPNMMTEAAKLELGMM